jgi:hypothetical protein
VGFAGGDGSSRATGGQSSDELLQALMSAKNAMLQVTTATSGPSPAPPRPPAGLPPAPPPPQGVGTAFVFGLMDATAI